jgi:hypothetical protein
MKEDKDKGRKRRKEELSRARSRKGGHASKAHGTINYAVAKL